jgi:hypothetical protein
MQLLVWFHKTIAINQPDALSLTLTPQVLLVTVLVMVLFQLLLVVVVL